MMILKSVLASFLLVARLHAVPFPKNKAPNTDQAKAVLGLLKFGETPFYVNVQEQKYVGKLFGDDLYKVEQVSLFPAILNPPMLLAEQVKLSGMVSGYLSAIGVYYSTGDLTKSRQCLEAGKQGGQECAVRDYFQANTRMAQLLTEFNPYASAVKAIRGQVSMECFPVNGEKVCVALVSRTSPYRTFTRYGSRGADLNGNVSNTVETEFVVSNGPKYASLVQVRGSMPFKWSQQPTWSQPQPEFVIAGTTQDNESIFSKHMALLTRLYPQGHIGMLNLVNSHGKEGTLRNYFTELAKKSPSNIKYHAFNYHAEIKNKDWKERMIAEVPELKQIQFFAPHAHQLQLGVLRTNCIDCLDRTNAAQTVVARNFLPDMIKSVLGHSVEKEAITDLDKGIGEFWADNANAISRQYAGTDALKTDIARHGKRTWMGSMWDAYSSTLRHFNANYWDQWKQEAMREVYGEESTQL